MKATELSITKYLKAWELGYDAVKGAALKLFEELQQDEFAFAYDPFKQPISGVVATIGDAENAALVKYGLTDGCFKFTANEFTGRFEIEALVNGEWIPFEGHFVDGRSEDFYNWEVPEELAKRYEFGYDDDGIDW